MKYDSSNKKEFDKRIIWRKIKSLHVRILDILIYSSIVHKDTINRIKNELLKKKKSF